MKKLTKIFATSTKQGCYTEISKKILGNREYIIVNNNELQVVGSDIFVNEATIIAHKDFFRHVKSI